MPIICDFFLIRATGHTDSDLKDLPGRNPIISNDFYYFPPIMRMTPSLPHRGEAAQEEHPLDPCFYSSLFSIGFFLTFSGPYPNGGDAESGGGGG